MLEDILKKIPSIQKIIIARGDILEFLPFEILTKNIQLNQSLSYATLPYLVHDYIVSYDYSAALLLKSLRNPSLTSKSNFLGFAPSYGGELNPNLQDINISKKNRVRAKYRALVTPLKYNREEVGEISEMVGGVSYLNKKATKTNFNSEYKNFDILHFAMHAIPIEEKPNLSFLAFEEEDDNLDANLLFAYEIYNLQMEANLIVLSACQTADGKLHEGEGVMSMTRAFRHAGSAAVLASLWKAEDQMTAKLMIDFYKKLKVGNDKSKSLTFAKRDFIKKYENAAFSHPFFWSNFILVGNPDRLEFKKEISVYLLFGGGILLCFLSVFIWSIIKRFIS